MEQSFYARHDDLESLEYLRRIFTPRDGLWWFIEHEHTNLWLCEDGTWTNNPNKCLRFPTEPKAISHSFSLPQEIKSEIIFTEHEFLNNPH